jgi:hypothetical protein
MVQIFQIVKGIVRPQDMATDRGRATRSADFPLILMTEAARLEIRRNFFSSRVIDNWNLIPSEVKNARTVTSFFKRSFETTERAWFLLHTSKRKETGVKMEINTS